MNVIKALRVIDYHTSEEIIHIFHPQDSFKILELLSSTYSGMEFMIDDVALTGDICVYGSPKEALKDQAEINHLVAAGIVLNEEVTALQKVNEELRSTLSNHADVATNLREENSKVEQRCRQLESENEANRAFYKNSQRAFLKAQEEWESEIEELKGIIADYTEEKSQLATLVSSLQSDSKDMTYLDNLCAECLKRSTMFRADSQQHQTLDQKVKELKAAK